MFPGIEMAGWWAPYGSLCPLHVRRRHVDHPPMKNIRPIASTRRLRACAWCERIQLDEWVRADIAIARLRTFEWPEPPAFTHGICDDCRRTVLAARETQRAESHADAA
jgi:hypothetical protein